MTNPDNKNAFCRHCTYKLVSIAYKRARWFRLFREPLKLGMCLLAGFHRIDPGGYSMLYRVHPFLQEGII